MFNALMYIKDLERTGVSREQAEVQVQLVMSCFEENVATKSDLAELKAEFFGLRGEFADLKGEFSVLRNDVSDLRDKVSRLGYQMTAMKSDLIIKLGGLMVICATLCTGILGLLIKS